MSGPLTGVTVVEVASIGPGPFCAMVLADMGASVVRVERAAVAAPESDPPPDPLQRGRTASIAVDLKNPSGTEIVQRLAAVSDVLIEGFRPGVMERLGLGPQVCRERNPGLVYGRMTGYGQNGPLAGAAGHDIDYLAIAGALYPIGDADRPPPPPLNLVADFGGGGLLLAFGIVAALWERERSGVGQVVDAAMVEGAALLTSMFHGMRATGMWSDRRAANLLDGAAPFYRTYRTGDGRFMAVGAIEPQFYQRLIEGLGLGGMDLPGQYDQSGWPTVTAAMADVFASRSREEWTTIFAGVDACVVPVNDLGEAPLDSHLIARGGFVEVGGIVQPAPAPRFSRSQPAPPTPPRAPGADADAVLLELGYSDDEVAQLRSSGAIG